MQRRMVLLGFGSVMCMAIVGSVHGADQLSIHLVRLAEAQVTALRIAKEYEGKPLTGVIVEIESAVSGTTVTLGPSVLAQTADGTQVSPILMTVFEDSKIAQGVVIQGVVFVGGEVVIGQQRFSRQVDLEEQSGSIRYTFKSKGKMQIAFVFPGREKDFTALSLLGQTIKLGPPQ